MINKLFNYEMCRKKRNGSMLAQVRISGNIMCVIFGYIHSPWQLVSEKNKATAANSFINMSVSNFNLQVIFSLIIFCKIDDKILFSANAIVLAHYCAARNVQKHIELKTKQKIYFSKCILVHCPFVTFNVSDSSTIFFFTDFATSFLLITIIVVHLCVRSCRVKFLHIT